MRYLKTPFQICLAHFLNKELVILVNSQRKYFFVGPYSNIFKLLIDKNFIKLRNNIFTQFAQNRREPFDHALTYLVSANKLLDVDSIDFQYTYLPNVSISSFSCELFLKAWIVEDQVRLIPSPNYQFSHVIYEGSLASPYLNQTSLRGNKKHNLKELFLVLPNDIKDFHIYIFDCFYRNFLGLTLLDALDKVKDYFINSRYYFESPYSQYDLYLVNDLANYFYEVFLFLYNWDGKVHTDNE